MWVFIIVYLLIGLHMSLIILPRMDEKYQTLFYSVVMYIVGPFILFLGVIKGLIILINGKNG